MITLLLAATLNTSAASESFELQNTQPAFLAGEFVASAVLGFVVPDLILTPQPDNLTCADAWCEANGFDEAVSGLITLNQPRLVGHLSHVFTIGLVPAVGFTSALYGAAKAKKGWNGAADIVIMLDAFMLSTGANSIAKVMGKRQRPAFYYGRADRTEAANHPGEEFLSFYSGDTNWAWTLAATSTVLAYQRGYQYAQYVGIATGSLAAIGSIMRIMGDMHWASDVLVGAVAGTVIGASVPMLLHKRKLVDLVRISPQIGSQRAGLAIEGRW